MKKVETTELEREKVSGHTACHSEVNALRQQLSASRRREEELVRKLSYVYGLAKRIAESTEELPAALASLPRPASETSPKPTKKCRECGMLHDESHHTTDSPRGE